MEKISRLGGAGRDHEDHFYNHVENCISQMLLIIINYYAKRNDLAKKMSC